MIEVLSALAPLFLITALGYGLAHANFGGPQIWHALDHLTFYVLFPALLTKTLMRADLGSVPAGGFVFVSAASVTIMGAAMLFAYFALGRPLPGPSFTSFFQGGIRFQSTLAVAVSAALFGEQGLTFAALSVATIVPTVQLYTTLILLIFGEGKGGIGLKPIFGRLIVNPLTVACILGLVLNFTGFPGFVYETFSILGTASIGLTLLAVGAGLSLAGKKRDTGLLAMSLAIRLVGMPVLIFGLAWSVDLSGLGRTIAIVSGAVPTAPTAYTMARKMGGDADLMAQIITAQSIAAAVTLPLFIYVSELL
jgi:predicted permease